MTLCVANSLFTTIPEGYVGVWKYFGQIQPQLVRGAVFYNPFFGTIELVKYIEDHDRITNVKCVSKEGVDLTISEVIISNKIDEKIYEMCKALCFSNIPISTYNRKLLDIKFNTIKKKFDK